MIKHVSIDNFGPIRHVDIECDKKDVFIIGPNGTGKSHILQAISLALTGKTSRDVTNDKLIGPYGSDFYVKLILDDGSIIERTVKGATLTLPDGRIYKKVVEVYEHLPFDPLLLFNVCFVKQGKIAEFFEGDTGKNVMSKLASLLIDVNRITEGYKALTARITASKKNMDSITSVLNDFPTDIDEQLERLQYEIKELKAKFPKTEVTQQEIDEQLLYHKNVNNATAQLSSYESQLRMLTPINKPSGDLVSLQKARRAYLESLDVEKQIKTETEVLNHFVDSQAQLPYIEKFFGIDLDLARLEIDESFLASVTDNRKKIRTYMTTTEFTTETDALNLLQFWKKNGHIDSNSILKAKAAVQEVGVHLSPFKDVLQKLRGLGATSENVASLLNKCIEEQRNKINNLKRQLNPDIVVVSDEEIASLSSAYANYNNYVKTKQQLEMEIQKRQSYIVNEKTKIKYTEQQLQDFLLAANAAKTIMEAINSKENQIKMLKDMIVRKSTYTQQLNNIVEDIESMELWKNILKDMPVRMRKALFHPVAYHLNKDFHDLFSFIGLGKIEIDWDNMDISIGDKLFQQLSGAQHIALGLSIRLALLKSLGQFVPIMLIDEPTQFMDDIRKNDVKLFLEYLSKYTQMFTCTHDSNIITVQDSVVINTAE